MTIFLIHGMHFRILIVCIFVYVFLRHDYMYVKCLRAIWIDWALCKYCLLLWLLTWLVTVTWLAGVHQWRRHVLHGALLPLLLHRPQGWPWPLARSARKGKEHDPGGDVWNSCRKQLFSHHSHKLLWVIMSYVTD